MEDAITARNTEDSDPISEEFIIELNSTVATLGTKITDMEGTREKSPLWVRRVVYTCLVVVTSIGTYGAKMLADAPLDSTQKSADKIDQVVSDVDAAQDKRAVATDKRISTIHKRQNKLAEMQIDGEVLTVDTTNYIVDIVKAGPRNADEVTIPESLKAAAKRTKDRRKKEAVERRFKEWDDDPLAEKEG